MTSWLRAQKKSELVDIAETIGLKNVASLKKTDLESSLDDYLTENASRLSSDPKLAPYFNIRNKAGGSPVKREPAEHKLPRRRITKITQDDTPAPEEEPAAASPATALVRTPARTLSLSSRLPLPSSPAEVAQAVDRSTLVVRERVASIYADSGITEATQATRESLSTVYSIVTFVSVWEWVFLRPEILADRYAFTIPAIPALGTSDYPVLLPDVRLLASKTFWAPTLIWLLISVAAPSFFGYFFNLSAASSAHHSSRSRSRSSAEYTIDPLAFSIAKALFVFVILGQGVTFGGWIDQYSVSRISMALYGGWKGALVGTAITGLASLYDAILRK